MRFHVGFSFSLKTIKKILIPVIITILLFFANHSYVQAETVEKISGGFLNFSYGESDTGYIEGCTSNEGNSCSFYAINNEGSYLKFSLSRSNSSILNLKKGVYYTFKFDVVSSDTELLYKLKAHSIRITSNNNDYYLTDYYMKYANNQLFLYVVPQNNYENISNIRVSFTFENGISAGTSFTMSSIFSYSYSDNSDLNSGFENVSDSINNSTDNIINNNNNNTQLLLDNAIENAKNIMNSFKDTLSTCRDSYNLLNVPEILEVTLSKDFPISLKKNKTYTIKVDEIVTTSSEPTVFVFRYLNGATTVMYVRLPYNNKKIAFTTLDDISSVRIYSAKDYNSSVDVTTTYKNLMIYEGSSDREYEKFGEQVCKNKVDETNDKLDDLNNSINNSDIDNNVSNGFFDNFSDSDNGGISAIVKAPLTIVNGLLSSSNTCPTLDFNVLGADVSFPSGCLLWDNADNSTVTIYQTIICGFFSYFILKSLFKDIENLKDPEKSEVSTLDL